MFLRSIVFVCLTAAVCAQPPDQAALRALDLRLDIQSSTVRLRTLRNTSKAGDAVKKQVDKLIEEAGESIAKGATGEARRRIYHAYSLLGAKAWTPQAEFAAGLLLRTDLRVMDPARRMVAHLEQVYPAGFQTSTGLRLHVSLHEAQTAPFGAIPGKSLRDFGVMEACLAI